MTKKEALRQTEQERALMSLGFTPEEAEQLRRISMTLHRWHERECGDGNGCIVRGKLPAGSVDFEYDDKGDPYWESAGASGRHRYTRIPDHEKGAMKRLRAIIDRVNVQRAGKVGRLSYYIQGDPRGAALYIIRPGDVPEGASVNSFYTRGICVY